ncbi:MAG: hypothetical protein ACI9DC_000341 [Gammaproteobacteria bacterium]|jgi:hypothetical protein
MACTTALSGNLRLPRTDGPQCAQQVRSARQTRNATARRNTPHRGCCRTPRRALMACSIVLRNNGYRLARIKHERGISKEQRRAMRQYHFRRLTEKINPAETALREFIRNSIALSIVKQNDSVFVHHIDGEIDHLCTPKTVDHNEVKPLRFLRLPERR